MFLSFIIIFMIFFLVLVFDDCEYNKAFSTVMLISLISVIVAWIVIAIWVGSPVVLDIFMDLL